MGFVDSYDPWQYVAGDPLNFVDPFGWTSRVPGSAAGATAAKTASDWVNAGAGEGGGGGNGNGGTSSTSSGSGLTVAGVSEGPGSSFVSSVDWVPSADEVFEGAWNLIVDASIVGGVRRTKEDFEMWRSLLFDRNHDAALGKFGMKIADFALVASGEYAMKKAGEFLKKSAALWESISRSKSVTRPVANLVDDAAGGEFVDDVIRRVDQLFGRNSTEELWSPGKAASDKVPSGWGPPTAPKKGVGVRWTDPGNKGNGIRIDAGNPANSQVTQQVDHVVVRQNGQVVGRSGQPISGSIADSAVEAHIPLSEWLTWSNWYAP